MKSIAELRKQKDELQKAMGAYMYELNNWDTKLQSIEQTEKIRQEEYKRGLEDAWELAKRVVISIEDEGMTYQELMECFGLASEQMILKMPVSDMKERYDAWKEKNNQKAKDIIQVGDVITVKGSYEMVVIEISVYEYDNNSLSYTCVDKNTGTVWHYSEDADIKKTGKHYILPWAKGETE